MLAVECRGDPLRPCGLTFVVTRNRALVVGFGYAIAVSRGSIALGRGAVAIARGCVACCGIVVSRLTSDLAATVPRRKPVIGRPLGCPFAVGPRGERDALVDPVEPFLACGDVGASLAERHLRSLPCLYADGGFEGTTQASLFRLSASKPQHGTCT